jgi:hypothetical protein
MIFLIKYCHELVDAWLVRRKLRIADYVSFISLEDIWDLEKQFEIISNVFVNSESEQQVK